MRLRPLIAAGSVAALLAAIGAIPASAQPYPSASPSPGPSPTASPAPGSRTTSFSAVPTAHTLIHPGDQLSVQVFGDSSLTQSTMVLADGTVDYPLIGRVKVAGKTPDEAADLLASHLHEYVRHPVVTVSISQLAQPDVLVLGDVKTPGKYNLPSDGRLTDAIAAAGGLGITNGAFPDARVSDAEGNVTTVSLEQLLQNGDTSLDKRLGEGSVVYVPGPIAFTIDVTGAVDHPGDVQLSEGDHLSAAIAKAGDSQNAHSDLNHVRIIHTAPDGKQTTTEYNLYEALKNGNESADPALQKGDVVFVPEAYQHRTDFMTGLLYVLTRIIP
jgi:polysaccharide biosynthesis/export protein